MENVMKHCDVTMVNFGDSIFGYDNVSGGPLISDYISQLTGAVVYNAGFGGCRMSSHHYDDWTAFSMYSLANAVTSGDFCLLYVLSCKRRYLGGFFNSGKSAKR